MSESFFGKGITIASGFDLSAKSPLDTREVVETFSDLGDHVVNNRVYDGMLCYVKEDKITYQYIDSEWKVFGIDLSNVGENTNLIIDNLNSILINASLSANQGRVLREMIDDVKTNYSTKEEVAQLEIRVNNKDAEIMDLFNNINQFLPKKISFFENDAKYLTEGDLEETLKHITIPAKTSDLINDAGYVTQENIDEVMETVPVKTSQLENDAGYVTQDNIDENVIGLIPTQVSQLENDENYVTREELGDISGLVGSTSVHIGKEPPTQTNVLWVDSNVTYSLEPDSFEGRLRLNYISMVNKNYFKLLALQNRLGQIEENIINISSEHNAEAVQYRTEVAQINSQISVLENRIQTTLTSLDDIETDFIPLKDVSKNIRREVKSLFYSVLDLNNSVMVTLDNEKGIIIEDNEDEKPDDGGNDNDNSVKNGLLTENGVSILTEDGRIILIDGFTSDDVVKDAILSELGQAILTEDGRILLKG